jgi:hypothetical protein
VVVRGVGLRHDEGGFSVRSRLAGESSLIEHVDDVIGQLSRARIRLDAVVPPPRLVELACAAYYPHEEPPPITFLSRQLTLLSTWRALIDIDLYPEHGSELLEPIVGVG